MNILKRIFTISILLIVIGQFISCEESSRIEYEYFLVQVDSIQIPDNLVANSPIDISFYGTISHSGYTQFSHFSTEKLGNNLIIECWAKRDKNASIGPAWVTLLQGEKLRYTFETSGDYLLRIKQPDNSFFEEEIKIE